MLRRTLKVVDKVINNKSKKVSKNKQGKKYNTMSSLASRTKTVSRQVIPYKHYSGNVSNIQWTFEQLKDMLESVISFLKNLDLKGYQHYDVSPTSIVYETYGNITQFYLGNYNKIAESVSLKAKKPVYTQTSMLYMHPSLFKAICSDDNDECIKHLKHIFTKMINNIYKSTITSSEMAYRLDKTFQFCKTFLQDYHDGIIQNNTALYSIAIVLLESCVSNARLLRNQFDVLLQVSTLCLIGVQHDKLLDALQEIHSDTIIEDTDTQMPRYNFVTNTNITERLPNEVCFQNDTNTTYIYYVRTLEQVPLSYDEQNETNKFIEVIVDSNDDKERHFNFFKSLSCQHNVLVYGSSKNNNLVVTFLQTILNSLPKNKKFNNVTIINECQDTRNVVYNVYNNNNQLICKKIINAITNPFFKHPKTRTYVSDKLYLTLKDNASTQDYTIRAFSDWKITKNAALKTQSNAYSSNTLKIHLEDTWWYKMYFDSPYCAFGRFVQHSGTCWFNSIINSLILVPSIAVLLIYMYGKWASQLDQEELLKFQQSASFDACPTNMSVQYVLYTIVYLIFVKGERVIREDNNDFIAHFASIIKSFNQHGSIKYYENKISEVGVLKASQEYGGDGYGPVKGMKEILKQVFPFEIATYLQVQSFDKGEFNVETWQEDVHPYVIVLCKQNIFKNGGSIIKTDITVNAMKYVLQSSSFIISDTTQNTHAFHAVAGLICNGKEYIYNSWNDVVPTNWTKADISNFLRYTNKKYSKGYTFYDIDYLVYVREDIKNIFERRFKELGEDT